MSGHESGVVETQRPVLDEVELQSKRHQDFLTILGTKERSEEDLDVQF